MAYYALDPWDGTRKYDIPAALVCSTVANANRSSKSKAFSPTDFLPKYGEDGTKGDSSDELLANMRSFSARQGKGEES